MSNNFNHIERWSASVLSTFPGLKKHTKRYYQALNYYLHRKSNNFLSTWGLQKIGDPDAETFFGYYDKYPEQNGWILFHQYRGRTNIIPTGSPPITISAYNISSGETREIGKSNAYNWQQGSRLHWLKDDMVIFNNVSENNQQYVSQIYSISQDKIVEQIDFPFYDTHSDFALSLKFKRLAALNSDYGYTFLPFDKSESTELKKDGIFYIDIRNNAINLLISFSDVITNNDQPSMKNAKHKFNHIMISPDGKKFMFIHRWYHKGIKHDSLMVANTDGANLKCVANEGMVSHCFWKDSNTIFGYLRDKQYGNNYYTIELKTGTKKQVGVGIIDGFGDGHPFCTGNQILFDTYPNKARMQELYLFNTESENLNKIGNYFAPLKYHESHRCDLHPRLSIAGNTIYIDSAHEGKRYLYRLTRK